MAAHFNIPPLQEFRPAFDLDHRCDPKVTRDSCILFGAHTGALMTEAQNWILCRKIGHSECNFILGKNYAIPVVTILS